MASESFQDNKKYQDLLATGKELFFKHGIKRITIEEICEKAGVSKMTFYKFFRNKEDLGIRILSQINDRILAEQDEIMTQNIPFIDKTRGIINHLIKTHEELADIFLDEMWGSNEDFLIFFNSLKKGSYQMVSNFIAQGQKEGVIRKSLKPEMILYLFDVFQGMLNSERMKEIAPDPHERLDSILNFIFYGIIDSSVKKVNA
ncbi:MAG: TetR/AcrR family transcriptional regulator [Spirochaetes bacterium]|nr:TetR/AcrR family transcriptional regulator [Spirochaetota bacterium]